MDQVEKLASSVGGGLDPEDRPSVTDRRTEVIDLRFDLKIDLKLDLKIDLRSPEAGIFQHSLNTLQCSKRGICSITNEKVSSLCYDQYNDCTMYTHTHMEESCKILDIKMNTLNLFAYN